MIPHAHTVCRAQAVTAKHYEAASLAEESIWHARLQDSVLLGFETQIPSAGC
jgi:hypothetical protein